MARYTADFVVTRDGVELLRASWYPDDAAESAAGWACSHACGLLDEIDEPTEACGWCESQGLDPVKYPCIVVECPNCSEVFRDLAEGGPLSFVEHVLEESCS